MTEESQKPVVKASKRVDLNSKFWKTILVLLASLLTFGVPTYGVYLFVHVPEIGYAASMLLGLVSLVIGLLLMWYLVKKKVIS
jgi:uncharacterized membrane protein